MQEPRRIAIMCGSDSDLWQFVPGLEYLQVLEKKGLVTLLGIDPVSIHRRTLTALSILFEYARMPIHQRPHFIITAAGWANHLSGCTDAFLRYTLADESIVVIAVAMEDPKDYKHTVAAITSTSEVPGIQAIHTNDAGKALVGSEGVLWACGYAAHGQFPTLKAKTPPPYRRLKLVEALTTGRKQLASKA